jgi:4-amino-4-deoxy-L-arabinose transferase-like glycosyltransferase
MRRGAALTLAVALAARLSVVAWAAHRFPPTADGTFYQRIAERIAQGLGYTWLWPDGAVSYAAHYPVGYPALIGAVYAFTGPRPVEAMVVNAALGALGALAVHALAARCARPKVALAAGLAVALHPGLVFYTPALMTEGVTASLVACAAAVTAWARDRRWGETPHAPCVGDRLGTDAPRRASIAAAAAVGLVVGLATLVRPQSLVLAPIFGLLAALGAAGWLRRAALTIPAATLAALLVCAPWTARNCVQMKHCALVSVNGGWNLLIGADEASTGAWSPVKVPDACREVFDEAQKDVCFGDEARRYVREHPAAWISLVPRKLAATFDYAGAAPWYLHESNPAAFPWELKLALGRGETAYEMLALLLALAWAVKPVASDEPPLRRRARLLIALAGVALAVRFQHPWLAYQALLAAALLRGRSLWTGPVLPSSAVAVLAATTATHAVFFGAGRYALVVFPLVTALGALALERGGEATRPGL